MSISMPSFFSSSSSINKTVQLVMLIVLTLCQLQPALTYVNPPGSPHQFQHHQVTVHRSARTFFNVTSSSPNVGTSSHAIVLDSDRTAATTVDNATTARATATTTRHHRQLRGEQRKTKAQPDSLVPTASPTKAMDKGKQNEYPTTVPSRTPSVSVPTAVPSSRPITRLTQEPTTKSPRRRPTESGTNTETPTKMPIATPRTDTNSEKPTIKATIKPTGMPPTGTGTTMPTKMPTSPPPTATNTFMPTFMPTRTSPTGANTDKPTGISPDANTATPTEMSPTETPTTETDLLVVPVTISILVTAQNVLDPINLTALIQTLQDYLMAGMIQAYPNNIFVTVTLDASSPNSSDSNSTDYAGSIVFSDTTTRATVPSLERVQAVAQALMLDMAAVQAAVDGNPDITPNQSARVRVEQIIAGNMSAVALSNFTMVVTTSNASLFPVNQFKLTETMEQYLTAGMMERYPNVVEVLLSGMTTNKNRRSNTKVDYSGYVVFSDSKPQSFQDIQSWQRELVLNTAAVQAAVDGNAAIGQDAQVEQVAVDGIGDQAGTSTSTVALPDFTIVVNTSDVVDQAPLTRMLQDYLFAGITEAYPSVIAVTLNGTPNQMDPTNAVDYTGYALFSGMAPPTGDVQALVEELLLNLTAVQAAVNGNPAVGQDALVEQVAVDGTGGDVGTSTSVVSMSDFSIIVTNDVTNTVAEDQLSKTLEGYLAAGMMEEYPNGVVVTLDGSRTQIDSSDVFDYTGYVIISNTTPPSATDVELLKREMMFALTDVQAAVDAESSIGQNARVEQVVVGDDSVVALSEFTIAITSDDLTTVDRDQLVRTLESYLMASLMQDFPDVEEVVLQPQQTQRADTFFFSGHAMFAGSAPDFRNVQSRARELLRDTRAVQRAVDSNPSIGNNVSVVGVVSVGDDATNDINTAAIVVGVVAGFLFTLILAAILMPRCRCNTVNAIANNEESPLAPEPPPLPLPLPSGVASK